MWPMSHFTFPKYMYANTKNLPDIIIIRIQLHSTVWVIRFHKVEIQWSYPKVVRCSSSCDSCKFCNCNKSKQAKNICIKWNSFTFEKNKCSLSVSLSLLLLLFFRNIDPSNRIDTQVDPKCQMIVWKIHLFTKIDVS